MCPESVRHGSPFRASVAALECCSPHPAARRRRPTDDEPTIEALLKSGWQIAGYTGAVDNWSTFVLFRHPDQTYQVQCRTGYDATREPHIKPHCYKLR